MNIPSASSVPAPGLGRPHRGIWGLEWAEVINLNCGKTARLARRTGGLKLSTDKTSAYLAVGGKTDITLGLREPREIYRTDRRNRPSQYVVRRD